MTNPIPPSLDRFGDQLADAAHRELSTPSEPMRVRIGRSRPRLLAGSTLGLAGIGAALVIAFGGSTAAPALAVTHEADGSVLVTVNVSQTTQPWVEAADQKLAAMGYDESIMVDTQPGAASTPGAVSCTAMGGVDTPSGPPVKVLLGTDGTGVVPSGVTGAGTVHLAGCSSFKTPVPGGGNT